MSLIAMALLLSAPQNQAWLVGSHGKPLKVWNHKHTSQICTVTVTSGEDHGVIDAKGCKTLGTFATAVKITGNYAKQEYWDAAGNLVATGKEKEDGYWFVLPDGVDYYLE